MLGFLSECKHILLGTLPFTSFSSNLLSCLVGKLHRSLYGLK